MVLAATGIVLSVFHDRAIGILALAFVAGSYTIFRHLAWIELQDSGRVILRGLGRPVRRNRTLLYYLFFDLVVLHLAWIVAVLLLVPLHGGGRLYGVISGFVRYRSISVYPLRCWCFPGPIRVSGIWPR